MSGYSWSWSWSSSSSSCPRRTTCSRRVIQSNCPGQYQYQYPTQGQQAEVQQECASTAPATISEEPVSQEGFTQFELDCLDEHNKFRAKHGCPPLKLNRSICNYSKEWAKYIASRNVLQHRSNNKYGENLYMSMGMAVDGRTAVKAWYDEIKSYQFGYGGFSMATGHFTQVVWKNSRELGVAFEKRGSSTYVVANYDPPGNYQGQFVQNVPPPQR